MEKKSIWFIQFNFKSSTDKLLNCQIHSKSSHHFHINPFNIMRCRVENCLRSSHRHIDDIAFFSSALKCQILFKAITHFHSVFIIKINANEPEYNFSDTIFFSRKWRKRKTACVWISFAHLCEMCGEKLARSRFKRKFVFSHLISLRFFLISHLRGLGEFSLSFVYLIFRYPTRCSETTRESEMFCLYFLMF
jgi:hypothetical protein